ncbi:MAG: L-histidine N(alpha)-methyltransferase [Gammaproteobacteria bacterium]|nr:L-histidine N(alpha)-methyltransferase [Gammaproteobacteria bacterium]
MTMLAEKTLTTEQRELIAGLSAAEKYINPKYFYDKKGSELFEQITQLDEYYPTRTESAILSEYAAEMANYIPKDSVIVEPGAGACEKIQLILEAIHPKAYLPQDVSRRFLQQAAKSLKTKFDWLEIEPIISDFSKPIAIPDSYHNDSLFAFYPGSTIGNFEPESAKRFLSNMRALVGDNGGLLIGMDLQKDPQIIEAAYNDSKGVTAEFNLNMMNNVNRHLGSKLDLTMFSHKAFYNQALNRIEMHLISKQSQSYKILGKAIQFDKGEAIHTENSYKFSLESIDELAKATGFNRVKTWVDSEQLFSLNFFQSSK